MSTLIIAEKPSLGRNIASALGATAKHSGYLEGEGYIVTWALGHLFSLCDLEEYLPKESRTARWTLDNLPCFPKKFKFELKRTGTGSKKQTDAGAKKQFEIIKALCQRKDVDTIVNAGDADREGEIIIRLCIGKALGAREYSKRCLDERGQGGIMRLWLPDQTPKTIRDAVPIMKKDAEYDSLASEGFARTYIDWLYGINLTRYATLKSGTLLRVGRVIVPIVETIYERDLAIRNFVPEKYYRIISVTEKDGGKIELQSKKKFSLEEYDKALEYASRLNGGPARVTSISEKRAVVPPGRLYSLSKLQGVLGRKYKMSMKESLDIAQKLYERGYLTYPRTNSEYLASSEGEKIDKILESCKALGYKLKSHRKKTVFDDSKIEAHSAITPTYKIPKPSELSEREMQVYQTVFKRFAAVFTEEECVVMKTTAKIASFDDIETFTVRGSVMISRGWTRYDDYSSKDTILPPLTEGELLEVDFKPEERETQPPKHYTTETLNSYLKNPFKEEKKSGLPTDEDAEGDEVSDEEEYRAILSGLELGTEATRAGIIENAKSSGYIAQTKDVYTILPMGEYLITTLRGIGISMDKYKTAKMGKALKDVYHGRLSSDGAVEIAKKDISSMFESKTDFVPSKPPASSFSDEAAAGEVLGKCPLCGGDVRTGKSGYSCEKYKNGCSFYVYGKLCGKVITPSMMKGLLKRGKTQTLKGFTSKTGKTFSAALKLEDGKVKFDFADNENEKSKQD